jgi:fatty acid CoA ligase FadD9
MSTSTREERFARRLENRYANDAQFSAAKPSEAIAQAINQPGLRLPQIIETLMEGYADRPALGQRAVQFVNDPSGRTRMELLPRFETITYRELWDRTNAFASALTAEHAVQPGDRVCILGFTSVDYTTIDIALPRLGAVSVPLQTGAAITQLLPIVAETEPAVIAASVDNLSDAAELVLSGHAPGRLVVFDYHPEVDTHREAVAAVRARLADTAVTVETLADLIERGKRLPPLEP